AIAQRERRELDVDRGEALLALGIELRAAPLEVGEGLVEEAAPRARERGRLLAGREGLERAPYAFGERDAAEEGAYLWLDRGDRGAEGGGGGDRLQVAHDAHHEIQALADVLEGREGVRERPRPRILDEGVEP